MLSDTITLPNVLLGAGPPVPVEISRYEETQNRTTYVKSDHLPGNRRQVTFYRTAPTKSGNFMGVGKSSVKFTQDVSVSGVNGSALVAPIIIELAFSVPVGVVVGQLEELRREVLALIDNDTLMNKLNVQLMV